MEPGTHVKGSLRPRRVRFGPFELDMRAGELRKHDVKIRLQEQPFQILIMLLEQLGEVVLREEIRKKLWPNDTIVEFDHSINAAIKRLRDALGDSAEAPRYVETVARRGYRFISRMEREAKAPVEAAAEPVATAPTEAPAAAISSDWIGRMVSHYRLLEKLGRGGMGEVYRASDTRLGRDVALKVLPAEFAVDDSCRERFEREARAVAALNHPNILALFDIGSENGVPYMVTEFVDGHTLREARLAPRQAIAIAEQAAEGLAAAHAAGFIHRDIKPDNVIVSTDGRVKILDFGLAKISVQPTETDASEDRTVKHTESGSGIGTSGYMSPEQLSGAKVDHRSDIFSFGVLLYELLSGKRAFHRETAVGEMNAILNEDSPELSESLPPGVRDIVNRCLEKKPEHRFQSAQDLAFALRAVSGRGSVNTQTSRYRVWRWPAAAVLILGLAAVVSWATRVWLSATQPKVTSLAVLPLVDLSPASERELNFAEGMTDVLIAEIGQIFGKRIRVISRTTMMGYKETSKTLKEIVRELKVDAVLEASVRRAAGTVEINVMLKNALEERLWGNTYERDYEDVLKLQREVARDIALGINLELTPQEEGRLTTVGKVNAEAHKDYLVGLQQLYERSVFGVTASEEYFKSAIDKDPSYATAHAGLAQSYVIQGFFGLLVSSEAYPNAKKAATKALSLDNNNAEAHMVLARVRSDYERDYSAAEAEYKLALDLNPNLEIAYRWYGRLLMAFGRFDEALALNEQSRARDPQATFQFVNMGWLLYMARRYEASIEAYRQSVKLDPDALQAVEGLAESYFMAARHQEAFEQYQRWAKLGQMSPGDISALERAFVAHGMEGYWRKRLEMDAAEEESTGNIWPHHRAILHARLGNKEEALRWLEKAYDEGHNRLMYLRVEPSFDSIRSDPRYIDLMRRVKLL